MGWMLNKIRNIDKTVLILGFGIISMVTYLGFKIHLTEPPIETETMYFLAVFTSLYVLITYGLLAETTRQRKQEIQPAFALDVEGRGVRVTNVGNGPALDTSITLKVITNVQSNTVSTGNQDIPSGESILLSRGPTEFLGHKLLSDEGFAEELHLSGEYRDQYQNRKEIEPRSYDLSEYRPRVEENLRDENELESIAKSLSELQREISHYNTSRRFESIDHSFAKQAIDRKTREEAEN